MNEYENWLNAEIKMAPKDKESINVMLNRIEAILNRYPADTGVDTMGNPILTSISRVRVHLQDTKNWLELVPCDTDSAKISEAVHKEFETREE